MSAEAKQPKAPKNRKRQHWVFGTGSLFWREDRKRWVGQIILETGKTRQRYFTTQEEAAGVLNEMLYEQKRVVTL
jgi:hypothetical protein